MKITKRKLFLRDASEYVCPHVFAREGHKRIQFTTPGVPFGVSDGGQSMWNTEESKYFRTGNTQTMQKRNSASRQIINCNSPCHKHTVKH